MRTRRELTGTGGAGSRSSAEGEGLERGGNRASAEVPGRRSGGGERQSEEGDCGGLAVISRWVGPVGKSCRKGASRAKLQSMDLLQAKLWRMAIWGRWGGTETHQYLYMHTYLNMLHSVNMHVCVYKYICVGVFPPHI